MIPEGRESPSPQCYECLNCDDPMFVSMMKRRGSSFHCSFEDRDFETWHMDVPDECPCKGKGWWPTPPPSNTETTPKERN